MGNSLFTIARENISAEKRQAGSRWQLDETYIKVKGKWKYFYRAVDPTVGTFRRNKITR